MATVSNCLWTANCASVGTLSFCQSLGEDKATLGDGLQKGLVKGQWKSFEVIAVERGKTSC